MLPGPDHVAGPYLNRSHRRVVAVIGENPAAVVDTDTNPSTPREDVPTSAVNLPRSRRIRVRAARVVNPSGEPQPPHRARPITKSHAPSSRPPPLTTRTLINHTTRP